MIKLLFALSTVGIFFGMDACRVNDTLQSEGSSSLLWKVYGNELTDTSYLYGTIHIQDERIFAYDDKVKKAFDRSETIAVEVLMDEIKPANLMSAMFMEDTTIDMLLSDEEYTHLENVYKNITGTGLATANKLKPFFLSANMVQALMPKDKQMPLDMYFIQMARQQNKNVTGLETLQEQITIIDELSYTKQMDMLMESIENMDEMKQQFKSLVEAYLDMNREKILKLMDDPALPDSFMDKILNERNYLMVDRMEKHLKMNSTFVAVGAAHLYGKEGIIQMLKNKGYKVEPVHFEFEIEE